MSDLETYMSFLSPGVVRRSHATLHVRADAAAVAAAEAVLAQQPSAAAAAAAAAAAGAVREFTD